MKTTILNNLSELWIESNTRKIQNFKAILILNSKMVENFHRFCSPHQLLQFVKTELKYDCFLFLTQKD